MTRVEHWATRAYHDFLVSRAHTPFSWGANDCALFAADGIKAMTGVDIAADFRGKYHDEATANAAIASVARGATVADAAAYCAHKAGLVELAHPLTAQRGDLVICTDSGNLVAGLVHLNGRDVAVVGDRGLKRLPITSVTRAWRV